MALQTARFSHLWANACQEQSPDPKGAAGNLVAAIGSLLEADQVEFAQLRNVAIFLMDLGGLGFAGMDLNVFMVCHPPQDNAEANAQAELLSRYKQVLESVGFCFQILLSDDIGSPNTFISPSLQAVIMSGSDLARLFSSPVPKGVMFEILCRQVQHQSLNPFNTTHEARGSMFRGRGDELTSLTTELDTNFVVTGARRIGKTSLIKKAYSVMRWNPHFKEQVHFFNAITWGDFWDCIDRLAHQIDPKGQLRLDKGPRNISYMLERVSHYGSKRLYLFFDELDRVVETDHAKGWPFFNVLREATHQGWVRVVFAGYRSVQHLMVGKKAAHEFYHSNIAESPFFGALQQVDMKPLNQKDTRALIAESMGGVGIAIKEETQVFEELWHCTAGSPFLVQFYGHQLFKMVSQRNPQEVRVTDIAEISGGYDLGNFLETHFLENTINLGRPVLAERLCAYLYALEAPSSGWVEGDFMAACDTCMRYMNIDHDFGVGEIHSAVENLMNASILTYRQRRYYFNFPLFREILREAYPKPEVFVKSLVREAKS